MKNILITFGWTERPVLASTFYHGLSPDDRIIFLIPSVDPEKSRAVIQELSKFLKKYVPGVIVEIKEIDVLDFPRAVKEIEKLIESGEETTLVLGGGMRILNIEAYTAAILSNKDVSIEVMIEGRSWKVVKLPRIFLGDVLRLSEKERAIMELLKDRGTVSLVEVRRSLNLPPSTAHKIVERLKSKGLLKKERKTKHIVLSLTNLGRLLA